MEPLVQIVKNIRMVKAELLNQVWSLSIGEALCNLIASQPIKPASEFGLSQFLVP